jgi:hypothetical protein
MWCEPGRCESADKKNREQEGANHGEGLTAEEFAQRGEWKCVTNGHRHSKDIATEAGE